jgi:hypothetical protein
MQQLLIEYCNPTNYLDTVTLTYKLRKHKVVSKWVERVQSAQSQYNIDSPGRFYGFGTIEEQTKYALEQINSRIDCINTYKRIIHRRLIQINDQDTLNYLHSIFEQYHGLLDQQNTEYWQGAPNKVKIALADLNILVHRCESVGRGAEPRHVVTWYGLPKTEMLELEDYKLFETDIKFGTVYLNYAEIGKTLQDLTYDNDAYISDDAFQPFRHYSADFNVKFYHRQDNNNDAIMKEYYDLHSNFFAERNLPWGHPYLSAGSISLADLIDDHNIVKELTTRQWVKSVKFI